MIHSLGPSGWLLRDKYQHIQLTSYSRIPVVDTTHNKCRTHPHRHPHDSVTVLSRSRVPTPVLQAPALRHRAHTRDRQDRCKLYGAYGPPTSELRPPSRTHEMNKCPAARPPTNHPRVQAQCPPPRSPKFVQTVHSIKSHSMSISTAQTTSRHQRTRSSRRARSARHHSTESRWWRARQPYEPPRPT